MDIVYRFDPFTPAAPLQPKNNRETLKLLAKGNERFAGMVERVQSLEVGQAPPPPIVIPVNPVTLGIPLVSGMAPPHAPFALVLGCSDARVPIEHILDCSANDLFVVRVAGNVLGLECLGSVDYAATHLKDSLHSVVVLAHTGCGAVTAAVDIYLSPSSFADIAFSHAVRSLLDRVMLSVRVAARMLESVHGSKVSKQKNYRDWLITTSVYLNAAVTAYDLQREVNTITKGLPVSYSVYDMARCRIGAIPHRDGADPVDREAFGSAPKDADDFPLLAERIIRQVTSGS